MSEEGRMNWEFRFYEWRLDKTLEEQVMLLFHYIIDLHKQLEEHKHGSV